MRKFVTAAGAAGLHRAPRTGAGWRTAVRFVTDGLETVAAMTERARQRRALANLDDHLLSDVGLTRADVLLECEKPAWRE